MITGSSSRLLLYQPAFPHQPIAVVQEYYPAQGETVETNRDISPNSGQIDCGISGYTYGNTVATQWLRRPEGQEVAANANLKTTAPQLFLTISISSYLE